MGVQVGHKFAAKLPEREPGKHLWVALAMFSVNPGLERHFLDAENLITIDGPGCFWCERHYEEAKGTPCTGVGT